MPNQSRDPKQQFDAVEDLLIRWLRERREVLGKYTEIAVTLDGRMDEETLAQHQEALCEILVDYVSAGHFEVFHELIDEAERFGDGNCALAEKLMPAIGDTTEVILAYEEKYGDTRTQLEKIKKIKRDLSSLGEVLESRFMLEDQLIAGLHNRYRRLVNQAP